MNLSASIEVFVVNAAHRRKARVRGEGNSQGAKKGWETRQKGTEDEDLIGPIEHGLSKREGREEEDSLWSYGTSEGVERSWESRPRRSLTGREATEERLRSFGFLPRDSHASKTGGHIWEHNNGDRAYVDDHNWEFRSKQSPDSNETGTHEDLENLTEALVENGHFGRDLVAR